MVAAAGHIGVAHTSDLLGVEAKTAAGDLTVNVEPNVVPITVDAPVLVDAEALRAGNEPPGSDAGPSEALNAVGGFNAEATAWRPANSLTIRPTIYPTPLGGTVTVEDPVSINIHSAEFGDFAAKLDGFILAVRQSNEIAREVGDKLIAELKAGQEYIAGPKPSRKVLDLLLVNPLVWAALGFAGTFVGEAAKLAFKALLKLISPDVDIAL